MVQHQVLRQEFQIDEAARAVLEVEGLAGLAPCRHLRPHVADGFAQAAVRLRQDFHAYGVQPRRQFRRSDGDAGADQRHVLPSPGILLLVALEPVNMDGERPVLARWTETQIDLEEPPFSRLGRNRGLQALHQAIEISRGP